MKKNVLSIGAMCLMIIATHRLTFAQEQNQTTTAIQSSSAAPAVSPQKHRMGVNNRLKRQQARINQGIKSGELTRSEAKNLERHDANIATAVKIERAENGGKLTPEDRRNFERRLNKQSGRIAGKKHNERER